MNKILEQLIQDGKDFYIKKDWEKAKKAFEDALSIAPENREAHAFLGSILVWQKNFSGALERFERVGADDPPKKYLQGEWGKILNDWGRMLVEFQRYDEAIEKFKNAIDFDPENKHINLRNWGWALENQVENPNRYEDAAKQYEAAVSADKEFADAWNDWGRMQLELKRYDEAIEKFKKALDFDSRNEHIYFFNWGKALEYHVENPNRYEEAAKQYEAAVNADGQYSEAWNNWGRMLLELKRNDEAIEKFKKASELESDYKHIYLRNWGLAIERQETNPNRFEEAARKYETAVNANDNNSDAWNAWGRMLLELKRYDEAAEKFKKASELESDYKHIYLRNWGLAIEKQENDPERLKNAYKLFEESVNVKENYAIGYNSWGSLLIEEKKYQAAIDVFKQAEVKCDPGDKDLQFIYYNWGLAFENLGNHKEAEKRYRLAVKVNPEYGLAYGKIGAMLIRLKDEKAFAELNQGMAVEVQYKKVFYSWGDALLIAGWHRDALTQYTKAVELDAGFIDAIVGCALSLNGLAQFDDAVGKINQAIELDPTRAHSHYILGWMLANRVNKDQAAALKEYEEALDCDSSHYSAQLNYGYLLIELGRYEEAGKHFEKMRDAKPNSPDGYHSLAYLQERLGRYKESQTNWHHALDRYEKIEEDARTADDWSFIAQIQVYSFHEYDKALDALEEGLERFSDDSNLLRVAMDIKLEAKDMHCYESSENLEAVSLLHWDMYDAYRKLKVIHEERLKEAENASTFLELGKLCSAMDDLDKAANYLDKSLMDPDLASAHNALGAIKMKQDEFKDAIRHFQFALNKQPHDFGYASNLAEAYRKAKMLDQAEIEYQKILRIAPAHIDSLIGLGETYAVIGDAAREGSRAADAELMYTQAIDYYSRVIGFEEKRSGRRINEVSDASKRLKLKELNAVHYARGYARVSLYDVQPRKDDYLLQQAKSDFTKLLKYEADENYHKARRAIAKISERLSPISSQNIESRTGPLVVSVLAFLLFVVSLFAFFKGRPEFASSGFVLTEQSLEVLGAAQLPPESIQALDALVGQEFVTQEGLLAAVELIAGEEVFKSYEKVLLAQPLQVPPELQWKPIDVGYFALMAFGSLIFMVAGLYLQQISKLKFGSIEIEKSSVSQISSSGALGIRK